MTATTVYVHTKNGQNSSWSRYTFPFAIDNFAQLGNTLYVRAGDVVYTVDESATDDDGTAIAGVAQWNWCDFGMPGTSKMFQGVDIISTGSTPSVSLGYNQSNLSAYTTPIEVTTDTLPGGRVRVPVRAPTVSLKITWAAAPFVLSAAQITVQPVQGQP